MSAFKIEIPEELEPQSIARIEDGMTEAVAYLSRNGDDLPTLRRAQRQLADDALLSACTNDPKLGCRTAGAALVVQTWGEEPCH